MKSKLSMLVLMAVAALAVPVFADVADDAISLSQSGVNEEVMQAWAQRQNVSSVTSQDIQRMRDAHVSDRVIALMLTSAPNNSQPNYAQPNNQAYGVADTGTNYQPSSTTYVEPSTTYVYDTPSYGYGYYGGGYPYYRGYGYGSGVGVGLNFNFGNGRGYYGGGYRGGYSNGYSSGFRGGYSSGGSRGFGGGGGHHR